MRDNDIPAKVTMGKEGANKVAINAINVGRDVPIMVRQIKYSNNIIEQDHRAIKGVTESIFNFKSFHSARNVLIGIQLIGIIRKNQLAIGSSITMPFADQFMYGEAVRQKTKQSSGWPRPCRGGGTPEPLSCHDHVI
ncbi:DDE-type integrase/transposase/recombinase [Collimonas pratensis]|nr:DDE-type integrase/transposase/recombinase [Collimonas pratensis]